MNTSPKKGGLRSLEKGILYLLVVLFVLSIVTCVVTAWPRDWYKGIQPETLSSLINGSHALIAGIGATLVLYAYILVVIHTSGKKYRLIR
jgi:Mn2+/Fe2+ NRAMP family transporter